MSEPHTSEQKGGKKDMYVSYVLVPVLIMLQSLSALILRVLASFVNSNTIHKLLSEKT